MTSRNGARLILIGGLSAVLYALVAWLSRRFDYVDPSLEAAEMYRLLRQRPIVEVLICIALLFALYLAALRWAVKNSPHRSLVPTVFAFALLFRLLLLPSRPIQEVDVYRYLWDGAAVRTGVNPYRYSPQQVLAGEDHENQPDDFRRLLSLRDSSPALAEVLRRVHFGDLPTVYPPVSQALFAAAALTTPSSADVHARTVVIRCWLLLFDLATAWLLLLILRHAGKPDGWVLAYAWCPLVLKEFANSGHLDSIAVWLTTAALYLALRAFFPRGASSDNLQHDSSLPWAVAAALVLAAAIGAKLYPIVLVPLLAATSLRRIGRLATTCAALVFLLAAGAVCAPLLVGSVNTADVTTRVPLDDDSPQPPPPQATAVSPQNPRRGLATFLRRWEMNDFLFLILVENLNPALDRPPQERAWFVMTPRFCREELVQRISRRLQVDAADVPFLLSRAVTSGLFLLLALWWSSRSTQSRIDTDDAPQSDNGGERFLELAFLTLAWFWLLLPTQNPWYWIWALPLVPFARGRAWLAMSGLLFLYYLRFWLGYHWPDEPVAGTRYNGYLFFDFVVTWIEFAPWFLWLGIDYFRRRRGHAPTSFPTATQ